MLKSRRIKASLLGLLAAATIVVSMPFTPGVSDAAGATRGRPQIVGNSLYSDDGTNLRGGALGVTKSFENDEEAAVENIGTMRRMRDGGANVVRIYWFDAYQRSHGQDAYTINESLSHLDTLVNNAASLGMYAIINFHDVGGYNLQDLKDFWTAVAPRYKDRTHVIYEMVNEPVFGVGNYTDALLNDMKSVNTIMRNTAPNTPIIHLSFNQADGNMKSVVDRYTNLTGITWGNKNIVGFHTYGTTSSSQIQALKNAYPVICTEWWYPGKAEVEPLDGNEFHSRTLENLDISWLDWGSGKVDPGNTEVGWKEYVDTVIPDARAGNYVWLRDDFTFDINVATNRKITTSSQSSSNKAYKAIDGLVASGRGWETSAGGSGQWISLDLGAVYTMNRWLVHHASSAGQSASLNTKAYKLQKSSDGTTWSDVDSVSNNTAGMTDRTVTAFSARYIRLYISTPTNSTSDTKGRIIEFDVRGQR